MRFERELQQRQLALGGKIGSGSSGNTYLVRDAKGECMALKRFRHTIIRANALEEALGMLGLCSWHTTKLYDAWIGEDSHLNILMEYCNFGNMAEHLQLYYPLEEDEVLSILAQLLLGLDHLHKKNIIHRDLKLDNILLCDMLKGDRPSVKLADYGLIKRLGDGLVRADSYVGTPTYVPPETEAGFTYAAKSDIWSLGVVMYTILTNRPPFVVRIERGSRRLVYLSPPHPCAYLTGYCKELGDCVMAMLHPKWKRRPSAEQLLRSKFLRETLRFPPWISEDYANTVWVFVRKYFALVPIYASCSTNSTVTFLMTVGDQVLLSPVPQNGDADGRWARVMLPHPGFVHITKELFLQLDTFGARGFATLADEEPKEKTKVTGARLRDQEKELTARFNRGSQRSPVLPSASLSS